MTAQAGPDESGAPTSAAGAARLGPERSACLPAADSRARGYLETAAATLINGSIGVMVSYATMPAGTLLTLRMAVAGGILGVPFLMRRRWTELTRPGVPLRLLVIGLVVAANLLLYFISIRYAGVAIAIFLSYMAPVYIAVGAPIFLRESTEGVVWLALTIALSGMALIVLPGVVGGGPRLSLIGVTAGVAAGVCYAVALMAIKSARERVSSSTIVLAECLITTLAMLPLGVYQALVADEAVFTGRNLLMVVLLGAVTTACSFTLFTHGMRFIKVQHSSIIGFIEPVSAPFYALLFLGQVPALATLGGGALIIVAGVVLVVFGNAQEPEPEDVHA